MALLIKFIQPLLTETEYSVKGGEDGGDRHVAMDAELGNLRRHVYCIICLVPRPLDCSQGHEAHS